ncbi:hypothetical protein ACXAT1_002751 [Clostridium sporogenes]
MEKSFVFNSINGDRKYKAEDFASYFASFIGNGVFPNPATGLQVIDNNNMSVTVQAGKGWINGYYYQNTGDFILKIDVADSLLNRIDRVVLRLDFNTRKVNLFIKKGTFASSPVAPSLQRDADMYELGIADIYVRAGVISIIQSNITDLRLNSNVCGIVHGVVDQVDTTAIFNQFQDWYSKTKEAYDKDIAMWTKDKKETFDKWYKESTEDFLKQWNEWFENTGIWEKDFNNWFETLKDKLDGNIAAKLTKDVEQLKKDVENIDIPVKSVNKKTGDIELKAADITTENGQTIETQLADITTQQGDLQNLKTTDKTNIVGAVNELFQNANNGKQNWVDVIGSPLNIEDTFSTLKNKTQNLKNSMAEKLTTKGQDSKGIEDLQVLINKIDMLNSYDIDMLFLKYGNIFNNLTSTNTSFLGINLKSKRIISKHTIEEKFNILDFQGNVLQTFIIPQEIGVPVYYDPRNDLLLCQLNYNYNDRITIIDINNNIVSKYVFASRYETAIMYFIDSDKYIYIVTRLHDNVQGYPELRLYKLKSDGTQIATLRIDNSIDTGRIDKDNSYIKERENDIIARVMWLYSDGCIILKTNKELNRYNKVHIPGNLNINIVAETLLI